METICDWLFGRERFVVDLIGDNNFAHDIKLEDAGLDLPFPHDVTINAGEFAKVPMGFRLRHYKNGSPHAFQLTHRSSVYKQGNVSLANMTPLFDRQYIGEVILIIRNNGPWEVILEKGTSIAQATFPSLNPIRNVKIGKYKEYFRATKRGCKALGSTG